MGADARSQTEIQMLKWIIIDIFIKGIIFVTGKVLADSEGGNHENNQEGFS